MSQVIWPKRDELLTIRGLANTDRPSLDIRLLQASPAPSLPGYFLVNAPKLAGIPDLHDVGIRVLESIVAISVDLWRNAPGLKILELDTAKRAFSDGTGPEDMFLAIQTLQAHLWRLLNPLVGRMELCREDLTGWEHFRVARPTKGEIMDRISMGFAEQMALMQRLQYRNGDLWRTDELLAIDDRDHRTLWLDHGFLYSSRLSLRPGGESATEDGAPKSNRGMPLEDVIDALLEKVRCGEDYIPYSQLKDEIGCSKAQLTKAFKRGPQELREWQGRGIREKKKPNARSLNQVDIESLAARPAGPECLDEEEQIVSPEEEVELLRKVEARTPGVAAQITSKPYSEKQNCLKLIREQFREMEIEEGPNRIMGRRL